MPSRKSFDFPDETLVYIQNAIQLILAETEQYTDTTTGWFKVKEKELQVLQQGKKIL